MYVSCVNKTDTNRYLLYLKIDKLKILESMFNVFGIQISFRRF